jgi:hypothetical protein
MDAIKFLSVTNSALVEFLKKEFQDRPELPKANFEIGFPSTEEELLEQTENKKSGFFSIVSEKSLFGYICPYLVTRAQSERTQERQQSTLNADDPSKRTIISRRGSENYKIRYLVLGPTLSSPDGQSLLSALITVFFDARTIEVELESGVEKLQIDEPIQGQDLDLERFLSSTKITRRPLYIFHVTTNIASGRAIEANRIVQSRAISFRQNISNQNKPNT